MFPLQIAETASLSGAASAGRRAELTRNIVALFVLTSERCTPEQIEIYDSILLQMADLVESDVRASAAERLAGLRRAPERTLKRLARDDIAIAWPVIVQSPQMTDPDLLDVINCGREHMEAVTERAALSERVTDRLLEKGDTAIKVKVAGNHGARFSAPGFAHLGDVARNVPEMALQLAGRDDTPDTILAFLARHATGEVKLRLQQRGEAMPDKVLNAAGDRLAGDLGTGYWLAQHDFESAAARIERLGGRRIASVSLLVRFAEDDRFAEVASCFALLADVPLQTAARWLVQTDTGPALLAAKAAGLRVQAVQALLKTGPWKHRLSPAQRLAALDSFARLDAKRARQAMQDTAPPPSPVRGAA